MRAANGDRAFGWVSRVLHWAMALLLLSLLVMGLTLVRMQPGLGMLTWFGLHKSLGLVALVLWLLRVTWHRLSPPPPPMGEPGPGNFLARWVHRGLYLVAGLVPLTGWLRASASGLDTVVFNRWTVPPIAPVDPGLEDAAALAHMVLTRLLIALILLHVAGALRRRDGTLGRMLFSAGPGPGPQR